MSKALEFIRHEIEYFSENIGQWEEYKITQEHVDKLKEIEIELMKGEESNRMLTVLYKKNLFDDMNNYVFKYAKDYEAYCHLFKTYKLKEQYLLTEDEFHFVKEKGGAIT